MVSGTLLCRAEITQIAFLQKKYKIIYFILEIIMKKILAFLCPLLSPPTFAVAMDTSEQTQDAPFHPSARVRANEDKQVAKIHPLEIDLVAERIVSFLESPKDRRAFADVSLAARKVVGRKAEALHKEIATRMSPFTGKTQAVVRTIFGRAVDCQVHEHCELLAFTSHVTECLKNYEGRRHGHTDHKHLSDDEFNRRRMTIGLHANILLREFLEPFHRFVIATRALSLPSEQIAEHATVIAAHPHVFFPAGTRSWHQFYLMEKALSLTSKQVATRAAAIAAYAHILFPKGTPPESRTFITARALDLTPEQITENAAIMLSQQEGGGRTSRAN
jgi:hypothetical protein